MKKIDDNVFPHQHRRCTRSGSSNCLLFLDAVRLRQPIDDKADERVNKVISFRATRRRLCYLAIDRTEGDEAGQHDQQVILLTEFKRMSSAASLEELL